MVVPWTSELQDIRSKLDNSFDYAAALNEVRLAFDQRGFTTIDFVEKYRNAQIQNIVNMDEWETEFKKIMDNSLADITVEVRMQSVQGKYGYTLNVLMNAVEKSSSESLANSGVMESNAQNTMNYAGMIKRVMRDQEEGVNTFLNLMESKFNIIRADGRAIFLHIGISENCLFNFDDFYGSQGDLLGENVQKWLKDKSLSWVNDGLIRDAAFNLRTAEASTLTYDIFRIPFVDKQGIRYDVTEFATALRKAIAVMGQQTEKGSFFRIKVEVNRNKVFLTITE